MALLARFASTDPWSVLAWEPHVFRFNLQCLEAHIAFCERRQAHMNAKGGFVVPVMIYGSIC